MLRSPTQAAATFSQIGGFPRQRNVFIVRFVPSNWYISSFTTNLTFAIKGVDRPHVNPKTEELNQYNKKRQIFVGYKLEPIKLVFYDSADGAAQNMWAIYAGYYFGDLNNQSAQPNGTNQSYAYDITGPNFNDFTGSGFGFTGRNGGGDTDAQWFFDRMEIYHFYDGYFDQYNLIHPRISTFDPDDLDYENSAVATISASIVYENLQYFPAQLVSDAPFPEFQSAFDGNPLEVPAPSFPISSFATIPSLLPNNPAISALLSGSLLGGAGAFDFRFDGSLTTGALGLFGNFSFGPLSIGGGLNLSNMSLGNPALSAALGIGVAGGVGISSSFLGAPVAGYNGQQYDVAAGATMQAASPYANGQGITAAALAGQAVSGSGSVVNSSGQIMLSPQAMGITNTQATGTSQIGVNTNSTGPLPVPPIPPNALPPNASGGEAQA